MAYVYKGTKRDEDTPAQAPRIPRPVKPGEFDPSACGTYAGYRRHQKHGVPTCRDCKTAMAAYSRDRYKPRPPKGFTPEACGTYPGYSRHEYHNVPPCDPCKAAKLEYQKQWREAIRSKPPSPPTIRKQCATYAGYMRHQRAAEKPCDKCRDAYTQYMSKYRTRRRAA